jgi:cobalamin synthase
MNKVPLAETISAVALVAILFLLRNTEALLMPKNSDMMLLLALIISFLVFVAAIWKESPADERENLHRANAGRNSFLVGSIVLVFGILSQARVHNIDPWLIWALIAMVGGKLVSRILSQWKN